MPQVTAGVSRTRRLGAFPQPLSCKTSELQLPLSRLSGPPHQEEMGSPSLEVCKLCWISTQQRGCGAPDAQSHSWLGRTSDIIFRAWCKMKM